MFFSLKKIYFTIFKALCFFVQTWLNWYLCILVWKKSALPHFKKHIQGKKPPSGINYVSEAIHQRVELHLHIAVKSLGSLLKFPINIRMVFSSIKICLHHNEISEKVECTLKLYETAVWIFKIKSLFFTQFRNVCRWIISQNMFKQANIISMHH